jgi:TATA-box binding protein (TBP) (component of TFIID and TFIIIB)
MYHNIANNTFSYLLTLDEFRERYPEELKPSWIKITTITMVSKYMHEIDIPKLKEAFKNKIINIDMENSKEKNTFKWSMKPTTFYNQITLVYTDDFSTKSIKVFPNGSLQVAGCSDLFDCKRIISELCLIFEKYLGTTSVAPIDTFRVVMINSNYSLNYNINLMKTVAQFEKYPDIFKVSFEPDRYSAVKIKFKPAEEMKEITVSIFGTGKIIITGAETLKEIVYAYNIINENINEDPEIRNSKSQVTELFDTFIGYKVKDLVSILEQRNFKSWLATGNNLQINF